MTKKRGVESLGWRYVIVIGVVVVISVVIFLISTQSSHRDLQMQAAEPNRMLTKLVTNRVIPGHPAYVFLMISDRVMLTFKRDPAARAVMLQVYANNRFQSALELYSIGEKRYGLSTLNKSFIYLSLAIDEVRDLPNLEERHQLLLSLRDDIEEYADVLHTLGRDLPDTERSQLDAMAISLLLMHDGITGHINQFLQD